MQVHDGQVGSSKKPAFSKPPAGIGPKPASGMMLAHKTNEIA